MPGLRGLAYLLGRGGDAPLPRAVAIRAQRLRWRDRWRYSPRRFRRSVDAIPLDGPIFVLGLQGGGTTLVSRCLLRHPQVVSMGGNSDFWVATDELGFVRNRMRRLPPDLWSSAHRTDLDHPVFGSEHASVHACDDLLGHYRRTDAEASPEQAAAFKRLLREHIAVYAHDARHARFVDKTHTYTVKIPYLDALLPGCRPFFVLVLRNPYTHCFRAIRRKPPSWRIELPYDEQLSIVAQHWENSFRLALQDGPPTDRFLAVRFEDFVRKPEAAVRAICDAVELPFSEDLVPQPSHRLPFGTLPSDRKWYPLVGDDWRGRVNEAEARIIEERCGALAASLGYERTGERAPSEPSVVAAA